MSPARVYPLSQPKDYKAPVPRWMLELPDEVHHVCIAYVGIQKARNDASVNQAEGGAIAGIVQWLQDESHKPLSTEAFKVVKGFDIPDSRIWVAYWTDHTNFERACATLDLRNLHARLPGREAIGLWLERFSVPLDRLETNYSGTDYLPGLARLPKTNLIRHDLTAYWGAARDRIPASGIDAFNIPNEAKDIQFVESPSCEKEHVSGTNFENLCHIRSGQWWEECPAEEREAYESSLEPALMGGMDYLWQHASDTGTLGLRFLRNVDEEDQLLLETCGAGFFRNLSDLEKWAKGAPSHLKIFNGALAHAKQFGPDKKLRTWHEVVVLKRGEAQWEYVNCRGRTGMLGAVKMSETSSLS